MTAADLNGDGVLDLVYTTGSSFPGQTLSILLGRGDGTFQPSATIALPEYVCGCAINVADVTGDGKPDIVLSGGQEANLLVAALPGNGDGTFGAAVVTTITGTQAYPLAGNRMGIGDLNGDGAADLVVSDTANNTIYLLFGHNNGTFTQGGMAGANYPRAVYLSDLNGDGHLDAVIYSPSGASATVYLGNGGGYFVQGNTYQLGASPTNLLLADINGDGRPDLAVSLYTGAISVLPGNGNGTFGSPISLNQNVPGGTLVAAADFTGDGVSDLALLNPVGMGVLPGNGLPHSGSLTFGNVVSSLAGAGTVLNTVTGDFNHDGNLDVAMGVEGGIALLFGKGDGSFISADFYDAGQSTGATAVADFNGDHFPDIAVTLPSTQLRFFTGDGTGRFNPGSVLGTASGTEGPSGSLSAADFNGDGRVDLVALLAGGPDQFGTPNVYFDAGSGAFAAPVSVPAGSVTVADVNGDGRADMVSIDAVNTGAILVQLGTAEETFTQVSTPLRTPEFATLRAIGDVNRDGKPDVIITGYAGVEVWLGKGDGTFSFNNTLAITPASALGYEDAAPGAIADLDGDGTPDLVLVSALQGSNIAGVCWGNGDGTFQAPQILTLSHLYPTVKLADVNGDGRPDLLLSDGSGIAVIETLPGRTFSQEDHYIAGSSIGTFSVADLNGDGYPDLIAADNRGTTVAVLLNQPSGIAPGGLHLAATLTVSPEPAASGQAAEATLTVTTPAGAPAPIGPVSFSVDGSLISSPALSNGSASVPLSTSLSTGNHTITAAFSGDLHYAPATFTEQHAVNAPVYTSTTTLTITPATVLASQTVRMQATVTTAGPLDVGTVTFYDGPQVLGSGQIDPFHHALFDTALLTPGGHSLTATYNGDVLTGSFNASTYQPSSSPPVLVSIGTTPTVTTLNASVSMATAGSVVTFTAQVFSGSGTPFGGVSFFDGSTLLGTASLVPGQGGAGASFSSGTLSVGVHSVQAVYNANATFGNSTSSKTLQVTAASASLATTLTSLQLSGSSVAASTLRASVVSSSGSPLRQAQGTMTFLDGGTLLGTSTVSADGTASLSLPAAMMGSHTLQAGFSGTASLAPSISPALIQQGAGVAFSINTGSGVLRLAAGSSAKALVTVAGLPTGSSATFSCPNATGLGLACSFSPAAGATEGRTVLTVTARSIAAVQEHAHGSLPCDTWTPDPGVSGLLSIPAAACFFRRRRARQVLGMFALVFGVAGLAACIIGCAANKTPPQPVGTSVLAIQASAGAGTAMVISSAQIIVVQQ